MSSATVYISMEAMTRRADQCPHYCEEKQDLYAPDVTQGPDGRYYLYYDLSGRAGKHGFDGPISVAVCDTPAGKYEYYGDVKYPDGRPLLRYIPFDPAVLNDDGHIYLTYGWGLGMDTHAPLYKLVMPYVMSRIFNKTAAEIRHEEPLSILGANIVELEDDMLTVKSEPRRILPAINNTPKGSRQRELITFCFLAAQGGCEPQLTAHAKGNMNIGNGKDFLIRVVSQCLPYIGYPRSLNAIQCVQKAAE